MSFFTVRVFVSELCLCGCPWARGRSRWLAAVAEGGVLGKGRVGDECARVCVSSDVTLPGVEHRRRHSDVWRGLRSVVAVVLGVFARVLAGRVRCGHNRLPLLALSRSLVATYDKRCCAVTVVLLYFCRVPGVSGSFQGLVRPSRHCGGCGRCRPVVDRCHRGCVHSSTRWLTAPGS